MHEFSLIQDLMKKIVAIARDHEAQKVVTVRVKLGALCHISAEHFGEHFADASAGTVAQGARLEIEQSKDETASDAQDILLQSVEVQTA